MNSLSEVHGHLRAVSDRAHAVQRRMQSIDSTMADDFLEMIRNLHGSVETLARIVETEIKKR